MLDWLSAGCCWLLLLSRNAKPGLGPPSQAAGPLSQQIHLCSLHLLGILFVYLYFTLRDWVRSRKANPRSGAPLKQLPIDSKRDMPGIVEQRSSLSAPVGPYLLIRNRDGALIEVLANLKPRSEGSGSACHRAVAEAAQQRGSARKPTTKPRICAPGSGASPVCQGSLRRKKGKEKGQWCSRRTENDGSMFRRCLLLSFSLVNTRNQSSRKGTGRILLLALCNRSCSLSEMHRYHCIRGLIAQRSYDFELGIITFSHSLSPVFSKSICRS